MEFFHSLIFLSFHNGGFWLLLKYKPLRKCQELSFDSCFVCRVQSLALGMETDGTSYMNITFSSEANLPSHIIAT